MVDFIDAAQVAARSVVSPPQLQAVPVGRLITRHGERTLAAMLSRSGPECCHGRDRAEQDLGVTSAIPPNIAPLATVEEIAAATRHSERTVRRWLRERRLAGVRVNRRWLIRWADVQTLLATATPAEAVNA